MLLKHKLVMYMTYPQLSQIQHMQQPTYTYRPILTNTSFLGSTTNTSTTSNACTTITRKSTGVNKNENNIDLNQKCNNNSTIIYINARSINANLERDELICDKLKPKVVCCSEARVINEIKDEININGYNKIICLSNRSKYRRSGHIITKTNLQNSIHKCS